MEPQMPETQPNTAEVDAPPPSDPLPQPQPHPESLTKTYNVHVSQLHKDVQDVDLALSFQQFGEIRLARVIRDASTGRSKGYGFVNFGSGEACERALKRGSIEVKGQTTVIARQKGRDPNQPSPGGDEDCRKTLYIGNTPKDFSEADLRAEVAQYGHFVDLLRPKEHYCFVSYGTFEEAELAFSKLRNQVMNGCRLTVQFSKNKTEKDRDQSTEHKAEKAARTLYINGLPPNCSEEQLKKKFDPYGDIRRTTVVVDTDGTAKGFGFVEYQNSVDAVEAQRVLNGTSMEGSILSVEMSRPRAPTYQESESGGGGGGGGGGYGPVRGGQMYMQPPQWGAYAAPMMAYDERTGQYVLLSSEQQRALQFSKGPPPGKYPPTQKDAYPREYGSGYESRRSGSGHSAAGYGGAAPAAGSTAGAGQPPYRSAGGGGGSQRTTNRYTPY